METKESLAAEKYHGQNSRFVTEMSEETPWYKMYYPGEWHQVNKDFKTIFHVDFEPFLDKELTVLCNHITIKLSVLEKFLQEKGMQKGESLLTCTLRIYGRQGVRMVMKLL